MFKRQVFHGGIIGAVMAAMFHRGLAYIPPQPIVTPGYGSAKRKRKRERRLRAVRALRSGRPGMHA